MPRRPHARHFDARIGVLALRDATSRTLSIVATHGYPLALVAPLRIDADSGAFGTDGEALSLPPDAPG